MKEVHGALSFCTKKQQRAVGVLRSHIRGDNSCQEKEAFINRLRVYLLFHFLSFILKQGMLHLSYGIKLQGHTGEQSSLHPKTIFDNACCFRIYLGTRGFFSGLVFSLHQNRLFFKSQISPNRLLIVLPLFPIFSFLYSVSLLFLR